MYKKVVSEIKRLEALKNKKTSAKEQLETEISEINAMLKKFYDMKKQLEALEAKATEFVGESQQIKSK